jgi:hypothetical protein
MLQRYAKVLKKYGGSYLVQSCNGPRKGYVFAEHKANIISALNDYGKARGRPPRSARSTCSRSATRSAHKSGSAT